MFQPPDQALDFQCADVRSGQIEWNQAPQQHLRCAEPVSSVVGFALEEVQGASKYACCSKQAIRFVGCKAAVRLPARDRAGGELNQRAELRQGEGRVSPEALEDGVREPFLHLLVNFQRLIRSEAEESHVEIWPTESRGSRGGSQLDLGPVGVGGAGCGKTDSSRGHVAITWPPYGNLSKAPSDRWVAPGTGVSAADAESIRIRRIPEAVIQTVLRHSWSGRGGVLDGSGTEATS